MNTVHSQLKYLLNNYERKVALGSNKSTESNS